MAKHNRYGAGVCGDETSLLERLEPRQLLAADLVAEQITALPQVLGPDESAYVSFLFRNQGDEASGPFSIQVRLSADDVLGNGEVVLDTIQRPQGLQAGAAGEFTSSVLVPHGIEQGTYFIAFVVDWGDGVVESNENNNQAIAPLATIEIAGEDHGTPNLNVIGNGLSIPDNDITPRTQDNTAFGQVRVQNGLRTKLFTLRNTGTEMLVIDEIQLAGRNPGDFRVVGFDSSELDPGESMTLRIEFNPSQNGAKIAQVVVLTNDFDGGTDITGSHKFRITGRGGVTGGAASEIAVLGNGNAILDGDTTPSTNDFTAFGQRNVNNAFRIRTFTIQNSGQGQLNISSLIISGQNASDFQIVGQADDSVDAGESTTFRVRFDPASAGNKRAVVTINSNDADEGVYTFAISGRGVNGPGGGAQEITVSGLLPITDGDNVVSNADGTSFGSVTRNSSRERTFTITNTGGSDLVLTGPFVRLTGRNPGQFSIVDLPDSVIAAGQSTTFTVRFTPTANGNKRAFVEILSNDSDEAVFNFLVSGRGRPN